MTLPPASRSKFRTLTDRAEAILLWVFTILLVTDVFLGILARYIRFEVVFADEVGKYIFIWLCATGIAAAARDNQHVRLTFISSWLHLGRRFTRITSQLLFLTFSLLLLYWSAQLTWMHLIMDKSVMGFRFPMYIFTVALPVGFALTAIRLVQDIVSTVNGPETKKGNDTDQFTVR